jgi:methylase of polypeptide subunit release factors
VTAVAPPSSARPEALAALRDVVARAGFTGAGVQTLLGAEDEVLARPADFPVQLRRLDGDESPLAVLVRIFVLLASESREVVDRALVPLGAAGLERLGLVAPRDERLVAAVRLIPHDDIVVASDLSDAGAGADHVPGVQRPSNALASLTVRRPVARALDVGTGNGIQALLLSRHADRVVATDVNERALAFAAFNLALNGAANVELRRGSFLEPVAGETFDLVVANPPYVISPETSLVFRDSGLGGDRVSAELVRALPAVLADGAFATVMVSWIADEDDAAARPRSWLEGAGCDAWILHTGTDDPLSAAAGWNRDAPTLEQRSERIERWVEYYRREGIERIAYGAIVLRRRDGDSNWVRAVELPRARLRPAGPHLERLFAAQDFLQGTGDDELLLRHRFEVPPEVRLEQRLVREAGGWRLESAELRQLAGLGFVAGLDEGATRVIAGLDGDRALAATIEAAAADLRAEPAEFRPAAAALVRRMAELGFLVPLE